MAEKTHTRKADVEVEELVVKVEPVYWRNGHDHEMDVNVVPMVATCRPHRYANTDTGTGKPAMAIPSDTNCLKDGTASFPIHSAQHEKKECVYTPVQVNLKKEVINSSAKANRGLRTVMDTHDLHKAGNVNTMSSSADNDEKECSVSPAKDIKRKNGNATSPDLKVCMQCDQCARVCKTKYALKSHMRIHDKEKWHKCPACSKWFYKQSDLVRHMRLHTGDKPYVCEVCGKSFSDPSYFRQHNRFHDGIKPYKCPFCDAAFTHKSHLTTHQRSHSGEKPFRCHLCEKTFGRRDYLKSHILIHTGVKSFHCTFCDKWFSKSSHLKAHVRSHTKEKPYGCDVCPSHFTRRSDLTRHRLRQHKVIETTNSH